MSSIKEKGFSAKREAAGFIHVPVLVTIFALLFVSAIIPVKRHYNDGKSNVQGVFLAKGGDDKGSSGSFGSSGDSGGSHSSGREDSNSGSSGSSSGGGSSGGGSSGSNSGSSSSGSGSSGNSSSSSSSGGSGSTDTTKTIVSPKPQKVETKEAEIKEAGKNFRVEVKTTPEKIKNEIRQGDLRIKFEVENGKIKIETKVKSGANETELENEAENEAVKEVEKELEKADVKIATAPGQVALVNKKVGALSTFPLSVNPTTKELTVTTPAGSKVVAVLPQQAIDNMLASRVMDDVVSEKVNNNLASIPDLVKLETENGVLGYKVKGTKTHKLLGFIPIKTAVEAFVSAENGQVVQSSDSLLGRILNRLAP